MRVGIFGGDLFWSNHPYEVFNFYQKIKTELGSASLILFKDDIRLNKTFSGREKFYFDKNIYAQCEDLITVKGWKDFCKLSEKFDLIYTSCKLFPKTRHVPNIREHLKCKVCAWDVPGIDILVDSQYFASQWIVKGQMWKEYLLNAPRTDKLVKENQIKIDTCPAFRRYVSKNLINPVMKKNEFLRKYNLDSEKKTLLIAPSNPGSHKSLFNENLRLINLVVDVFLKNDFQIILKTYPHDYIFYENQKIHSGVYKRKNFLDSSMPQYEFLKRSINSDITVVESQHHHEVILYSDFLYNMSGTSLSWETYYSECQSFSISSEKKNVYKNLSYLPGCYFPHDKFNISLENDEKVEYCINKLINNKDKSFDYKKTDLVKKYFY